MWQLSALYSGNCKTAKAVVAGTGGGRSHFSRSAVNGFRPIFSNTLCHSYVHAQLDSPQLLSSIHLVCFRVAVKRLRTLRGHLVDTIILTKALEIQDKV